MEITQSTDTNQKKRFRNWKESSQFTSNDIIDAYQAGKKAGLSFRDKFQKAIFSQNIVKAFKSSEELLKEFFKNKVLIKHLFIKPEAIENFEVLFIVDKEAYFSDKLKKAYLLAKEKRKKENNNVFSISFIFMPDEGSINFSAITGDGFIFQYDDKTKTSKSRKT